MPVAQTEIIITGQDQTGPTWASIRQQASQSIEAITRAVATGSSQITSTAAGAAGDLAADFAEAGREAGQELSSKFSAGLQDVGQDARRAGQQAGDDLAAGLADGVAAGASEIRSGASRALDGVEEEADQAGREAGSALKDRLAAGGLAAGAALTAALAESVDAVDATTKLSAQLGGGEWAAQAGRIAGAVYGRGVVESMDEATQAVRAVLAQGLVPEDSSAAYIESITSKVSSLSTAFDQDLIPITRAAGKMLKTGLAANGAQALDILAKGFQSNVNEADDLVDTFSEYSVQFRKSGLTGAQALGMMSQALRAGARDSDIAADAIKEFGIQAMSPIETLDKKGRLQLTAVGQAFINVGLDGNKAQAELAKGGASAAGVLDKVLAGLRGIEDPIMRSQVAVALFGTQAEDMGDALYAMDPSTAVAGLGKIGGAADNVAKTMEEGPTAKFKNFKRELLAVVEGPMKTFISFAAEHSQVFVPLAAAIMGVSVALAAAAGAMWLVNVAVAANPIVLAIGAAVVVISGLVAALFAVWQTNDKVRGAVTGAWNFITSSVSSAVSTLGDWLGRLVGWFMELPGRAVGALQGLPGRIGTIFSSFATTAMYWVGYGIGVVVREMIRLPGRIMSAIAAAPGVVWSIMSQVASRMWSAAGTAVSRARQAFAAAPEKIRSAISGIRSTVTRVFSNAGSWLYDGGRAVVRGAINGIRSMAGDAYNAVSGMGSSMVNGFRDAIGWHSPAKVFIAGGKAVVDGLRLGILKNRTSAVQELRGVGHQLDIVQKQMTNAAWKGPLRVTTPQSIPIVASRLRAIGERSRIAYAKKHPSATGRATGGGGGYGGGDVTVTISLQGGDGGSIEDLIMQVIRKRIRVEYGGSVQAALGA